MNCGELFNLFKELGGRLSCNMKEDKCIFYPRIADSRLQTYNHEKMVFEPNTFSCNGPSKYKNEEAAVNNLKS